MFSVFLVIIIFDLQNVQEQLEAVNTEHSDITKKLKKTDAMIDVLSRLCQVCLY